MIEEPAADSQASDMPARLPRFLGQADARADTQSRRLRVTIC
jgi:hypothetical protein